MWLPTNLIVIWDIFKYTYQSDEDSLMGPSGASLLDPLLLVQCRGASLLLPLPFDPLELECLSCPVKKQKNLCKTGKFKLRQLTNTRPTRPIPIPIVPFTVSIPKPVPFPLPLDPFSRFLPLRHLRLTVVIILFARGTDVLRPIPDFQYPVSVVPLQLHTFRRRS